MLGSGGDVVSAGFSECSTCETSSCLHIIHNTPMVWEAGRTYCEHLVEYSQGLTLFKQSHYVMILTEEKLAAVKQFLNNLTDEMKPMAAWIGLHSETALSTCSYWEKLKCFVGAACPCKKWSWLDAIPADSTPNNWAPGQPKGAWTVNGGNCAKMARNHNWEYFDDPCSTSLNFLRQPNAVLCEATR